MATLLREAFRVTVCDPLCEVVRTLRDYVQSRSRENGFVKYFRLCCRAVRPGSAKPLVSLKDTLIVGRPLGPSYRSSAFIGGFRVGAF